MSLLSSDDPMQGFDVRIELPCGLAVAGFDYWPNKSLAQLKIAVTPNVLEQVQLPSFAYLNSEFVLRNVVDPDTKFIFKAFSVDSHISIRPGREIVCLTLTYKNVEVKRVAA